MLLGERSALLVKSPYHNLEDVCEARRTLRGTCRQSKVVALQAWKRDVEGMRPEGRIYELASFVEADRARLMESLRKAVEYFCVQWLWLITLLNGRMLRQRPIAMRLLGKMSVPRPRQYERSRVPAQLKRHAGDECWTR